VETVVSEYEREHRLYEAMLQSLRATMPPKALETRCPPDLLQPWLEEWVKSSETLKRGRCVTDLYRLGSAVWPSAAQILKGGTDVRTETLRADARGPYGLHVIVRNVSKQPVLIQTAAREIVKKRSDRGVPLRWDDRPVMVSIAPEETLDLALHYAVTALRMGTWRIYEPDLWETSGAIPQRDTLVEVAYSLDLLGIDSRQIQEPRTARKAG